MTHALLVRRSGQNIVVIDGPLPLNEAVDKWKARVNADVSLPPSANQTGEAIEVMELRTTRSHRLRGAEPLTEELAERDPLIITKEFLRDDGEDPAEAETVHDAAPVDDPPPPIGGRRRR